MFKTFLKILWWSKKYYKNFLYLNKIKVINKIAKKDINVFILSPVINIEIKKILEIIVALINLFFDKS